MFRISRIAVGLIAAIALTPAASAMTSRAVIRDVPFVAAFRPLNSHTYPFSGVMRLSFNHGIIKGWYTDTSIKAGSPLANVRHAPVSGGISHDSVRLRIRGLWLIGTMHRQVIRGSIHAFHQIYVFTAKEGSPGHPFT
jgi:hypothetical protein